jgi:enoyl-CoA hydratase/carnithine racemase
MAAELLAHRHESILVLTLSNPGVRNALHPDMYAAGVEAFDIAERDAAITAVVITGAEQFFCAGGNLHRLLENRARDPIEQAQSIDALAAWITAIRNCSKPVIAAVEGAAAGAGFSLVLACDMVVSADDAKYVMAYARVGLTPDGGGSWFLARNLPRPLASEILLEGKPASAARLHQAGLINRLVKSGTALDQALEWALQLSQISPHVIARMKNLIDQAASQPLADHLVSERDSFVESLFHRDGLEGISAFLEKRPARYL